MRQVLPTDAEALATRRVEAMPARLERIGFVFVFEHPDRLPRDPL